MVLPFQGARLAFSCCDTAIILYLPLPLGKYSFVKFKLVLRSWHSALFSGKTASFSSSGGKRSADSHASHGRRPVGTNQMLTTWRFIYFNVIGNVNKSNLKD